MENIKNLLEDWQKTLNMVINSKMTILNIDSRPMDLVSQEAMGDYSKPNGFSDSDSDLRNSLPDSCYDEYNQSWMPNHCKPYAYNYDVSIFLFYIFLSLIQSPLKRFYHVLNLTFCIC